MPAGNRGEIPCTACGVKKELYDEQRGWGWGVGGRVEGGERNWETEGEVRRKRETEREREHQQGNRQNVESGEQMRGSRETERRGREGRGRGTERGVEAGKER